VITRTIAAGVIAGAAAIALVAMAATPARAQRPQVGELAPDFTLPGSTQAGLLARPIHLADFRGQVVVLAFFPKARTKG
jgi:peroxiredoxin Q/BCP